MLTPMVPAPEARTLMQPAITSTSLGGGMAAAVEATDSTDAVVAMPTNPLTPSATPSRRAMRLRPLNRLTLQKRPVVKLPVFSDRNRISTSPRDKDADGQVPPNVVSPQRG